MPLSTAVAMLVVVPSRSYRGADMPRFTVRVVAVAGLAAVVGLVPSVALTLSAQPQQPPAVGKKYAVLVGVNAYRHKKLDDLRFAERDVTELGKELTRQGFEVTVLTGSGAGRAEATRANVEATVARVLRGVTKRDVVLVALSGHGMQFKPAGKPAEEPFFCPVDAVPLDPARLVAVNGLLKQLDDAGAGTNLVLIDACRDDPDPDKGGRGIDGSRALAIAEGTAVFLACGRRQRARETDKTPAGGHGVFVHAVLDGLRGGAARDGLVTWDGLVDHVKRRTAADMASWFPDVAAADRQKPQAISNLADSVVLAAIVTPVAKTPVPPSKTPGATAKSNEPPLMAPLAKRPADPPATVLPFPPGSLWVGETREGNMVFPGGLTILESTTDKVSGECWMRTPDGIGDVHVYRYH